jgi:hypothetical protein
MKITKKDRELAAQICAIAASNVECHTYDNIVAHFIEDAPFCGVAHGIALEAWAYIERHFQMEHPGVWIREVDAEAEAMIRTLSQKELLNLYHGFWPEHSDEKAQS